MTSPFQLSSEISPQRLTLTVTTKHFPQKDTVHGMTETAYGNKDLGGALQLRILGGLGERGLVKEIYPQWKYFKAPLSDLNLHKSQYVFGKWCSIFVRHLTMKQTKKTS